MGAGIVRSQQDLLVPFGTDYVSVVVHLGSPAKQRSRGTVFCFHGFTGNSGDFLELTGILASNGFRTVAPDAIGRGASGHFARQRQYGFRNTMQGAAAAYAKFRGARNHAIGVGWGGLLALVGASTTGTPLNKLILAGLPLNYRVSEDQTIVDALNVAGKVYGTLEDAAAALLRCNEFAGLAEGELARFSHRLRTVEGGFSFNFDAAIASRAGEYGDREFHVDQLLEQAGKILLLNRSNGGLVPAPLSSKTVFHPRDSLGPIWAADELLLSLGFLLDRSA